jgi:rhodanese-related sulfurtransferase
MRIATALAGTTLAAVIYAPTVLSAEENKITPTLTSVVVMDHGKKVTIGRGHDPNATLPPAYDKTDRGCPPFCVQPMHVAPGVETIGELDVLDYLKRMGEGDSSILVVDSRTPDWVMRGTIPGSVNIPWTELTLETGSFETPTEAKNIEDVLRKQFGATKTDQGWDFGHAKTLVLFCNGIWCHQSSLNVLTLLQRGYPADKIKWYRGGMQDWVSVGLTIVKPVPSEGE